MGKGTSASGKPSGGRRATGPDKAGAPGGATRHAREARRRQQPRHTDSQGTRGRKTRKAGDNGAQQGGGRKKRGGGRQGPRHPRPENTQSRTQRGRNKRAEGKKNQEQPQTGQPQPGGGRTSKERTKTGQRKGEAHQNAPGRPARPTQPSRACTRTHARDPGEASSVQKGAVSASTRNSPGAPAESPVERQTVRETGRVVEWFHTRQTTAGHAAQDRNRGDPPGTAPNGYDAEGTQRPCLGRGQRQAQRAPFSAGLHRPRAATQYSQGRQPPGWGKAPGRRESRPEHRKRPDWTGRGAPTRGHEARQKGTLPARTTAREQVPSDNSHRMPRTREARTTHDETRHGTRSQGQPGPHARTLHQRPVGSGLRPHARKDRWSGVGERPSLDAPHPGKWRPLRAPSCRPHSAQSQLARARAVGLVTGPHARIPRNHSQWVVGPGCTPKRTSGRGWESA